MDDYSALLERLKENDETARKFYLVETKILSVLNFRDLFDVLLSEIRETFKIPHVWISLIEKSEVLELFHLLEPCGRIRGYVNLVEKEKFLKLAGDAGKPILTNTNISEFSILFPPGKDYSVKSMAVIPLSLDGEIVGSLNQADDSQLRFDPSMDTSLLERLAVKLSLCFSNVTAHEKLNFLAYHDPLTGLLNRRVMESALAREASRALRYKSPLSVAFIDLDDFKSVNDTNGHDVGDDFLKYISEILTEMCRESDIVSRYAGDEFIIILPETTGSNAKKLVNRIKEYLQKHPFLNGDHPIPVSISFGVSSTEEEDAATPKQLLTKADERLYEAKNLALALPE